MEDPILKHVACTFLKCLQDFCHSTGVQDRGKNVRRSFPVISRTPITILTFLSTLEEVHTYSFKIRYATPLCVYSCMCKGTKRLRRLDPSIEN